jgi:hypothetical protein
MVTTRSVLRDANNRRQLNEDSCKIYKLTNDLLQLIFQYVGGMQYGFVACTSYRFSAQYLDTFNDTITSYKNAVRSVSCAAFCLQSDEPHCYSSFFGLETNYCSRAMILFRTAALEGKLEILIWGEDSGYELKKLLGYRVGSGEYSIHPPRNYSIRPPRNNQNIIAYAARKGHLNVVQYMRNLGIGWDERTCRFAAMNGHLELLKWCRANQCTWDDRTCAYAALNGHFELLKWCRENQCPWDEGTCANAAAGGHLKLLKWARANHCPWNEGTCAKAAAGGHLKLLKWARTNGCPWNTLTCSNAARKGHLDVLKYARANQCPTNEKTCEFAAENGHLELLQWARADGCAFNEIKCNEYIEIYERYERELLTQGCARPCRVCYFTRCRCHIVSDYVNYNSDQSVSTISWEAPTS